MKTGRQTKILPLIRDNNIETQAELLMLLRSEGYSVTQATVSRDIKEMRLIKVLGADGSYKYSSESSAPADENSHIYLFSTAVTSVDYTHSLVVIKTRVGMAQAVCAALDSQNRVGVLGTIAGDDTIFVATRTDSSSAALVNDIKKLMNDKKGL